MVQMKEEAIARGEAVPESESDVEEEMDPGVIPKGDNATVLTHVMFLSAFDILDYQQLGCHFRSSGCSRPDRRRL